MVKLADTSSKPEEPELNPGEGSKPSCGSKCCKRCGVTQSLEMFFLHPKGRDGRSSRCKRCISNQRKQQRKALSAEQKEKIRAHKRIYNRIWSKRNPEKMRAKQKRLRARHPERYRGYFRKSTYGVTEEVFKQMQESQAGRCALCKKERRLVIDHDHITGAVRKLLCYRCNLLVGIFESSRDLEIPIKEYLSHYGSKDLVEQSPSTGGSS